MSVPRHQPSFGSLLRESRLDARLTQEALAERSGVSLRTIQQIESDRVRPRRATRELLANALRLAGPAREALVRSLPPAPRGLLPSGPDAGDDARPRAIRSIVPLHARDGYGAGDDWGHPIEAHPRLSATNIPYPVSSLLGREGDLTAIRRLIAVDHQRLVTLLGVGGAGKTRVAVQVAADLLGEFPDGAWLVELAPVTSPALVPRLVAGVLGVREGQDAPMIDTLLGSLRWKRALLVLDNCEHLIEACADLAEQLLRSCPDLHILATSREPLRIDGERRWQVRPLAVPRRTGSTSFGTLANLAAVRLFEERAQAIDADFRLTEANVSSVGRICTLLDGIPLAIELAASQVGVLSVAQIVERLEGGFRVLAGGRRTAPIRQQTMEAALDWSHDLLTTGEQALFRRLATFAGGFDLEAAEAIPAPNTHASTLDVLGLLVDKSLVVAEREPMGRRYRLLEPVRQYAQHLLMESGEDHEVRARHAAYYAALAVRAAPMLHGPEQIAWLDRLEGERNNLRAALSWIAEQGAVEDGLRVAVALVPYWEVRGHFGEGRRWIDAALARDERLSPTGQRSARLAAGRLAFWHGDLAAAVAHFEVVSPGAVSSGDAVPSPRDADALTWLGAALGAQGAFAVAESTLQEALALQEARGDAWGAAWALFNLGRTVGNRTMRGTREHAGMLHTSDLLGESLRRFRAIGDLRFMAIAATYQGIILVHADERTRAAQLLHEGLAGLQAVGERAFLFPCIIALSVVAVVLGQPERAARLLGAAETLSQALGTELAPVNRRTHENAVSRIRPALSADAFAAARAHGWSMTLTDVLNEASDLASTAAPPA
jgi:non-specific serine/threonine protein kinase